MMAPHMADATFLRRTKIKRTARSYFAVQLRHMNLDPRELRHAPCKNMVKQDADLTGDTAEYSRLAQPILYDFTDLVYRLRFSLPSKRPFWDRFPTSPHTI